MNCYIRPSTSSSQLHFRWPGYYDDRRCLIHQEVGLVIKRGRARVFKLVSTRTVYRCYVTVCNPREMCVPCRVFGSDWRRRFLSSATYFANILQFLQIERRFEPQASLFLEEVTDGCKLALFTCHITRAFPFPYSIISSYVSKTRRGERQGIFFWGGSKFWQDTRQRRVCTDVSPTDVSATQIFIGLMRCRPTINKVAITMIITLRWLLSTQRQKKWKKQVIKNKTSRKQQLKVSTRLRRRQ